MNLPLVISKETNKKKQMYKHIFQQNRSQGASRRRINICVVQNEKRKKPNRYCTRYMLEEKTGSCLSARDEKKKRSFLSRL